MPPSLTDTSARPRVIPAFTDLAVFEAEGPRYVTRGNGIYVYDRDGNEYIEGAAGLWCTSLGFGDQELIAAATEQMRVLSTYHSFFNRTTPPLVELADRIISHAPSGLVKVFFANSGSEANDTAIKIVRYYNNVNGRLRKKKIISRLRSFHGVTIGSGSLTGGAHFHRDFDLPIEGILHTACPDYYGDALPGESEEDFASRLAVALEAMILAEDPATIAGFIADPIMCGAGVLMPPRTYFEKVQAILRRHDILFIVDEVITGFGRTGKMFSCETFGLTPDLLICAKALTSGYFPMSAVIVSGPVWSALVEASRKEGPFWHGFTSGGHPVGAAIALRTLDRLESGVLDHARQIEPYFQNRIREFTDAPLIGEVRGIGLLGALQIAADKTNHRRFPPEAGVGTFLSGRAEMHGLIVMVRGEAICLCPPLIITEVEIDQIVLRLAAALRETEEALAAGLIGRT
jgi:4-aminobutyrate---pyruvate transaminase